MKKSAIIGFLVFILMIGLASAAFAFPRYLNKGIDFLNAKKSSVSQLEKRIPDVPKIKELSFKLGLDLQGGLQLTYEPDFSNIPSSEYDTRMEGVRDVIERRANFFGVAEPLVQIQGRGGSQRLVVELPGVTSLDQVNESLKSAPFLDFRELKEDFKAIDEANRKFLETGEGQYEEPFKATGLTGAYLTRADVVSGQFALEPVVTLTFNEEGAKMFEQITEKNLGKPVAIYLDGIPIQTAIVQAKISGGEAQITGIKSREEAVQLVRNLNAGAVHVPLQLISQRVIGPTLGALSIQESLKAGFIGVMAVIAFMLIFYRLPGLFACFSLIFFLIVLLLVFKVFPITLTLAGIAGIILSAGMAVDANILIFSRMREELKTGKGFSAALKEGFSRAIPSIRDGNLTTIIVTLILFFVGSSFVQGFALLFLIGTTISVFSAIFVTTAWLKLFEGTRLAKAEWLWR